ncbi:MAG TPA: thiolase family protein [Terrimicrobiaceae bacterium]
MKAERIIVIAGVRTPFTKAGTSLAQVSAMDLARTAMLGVLVRSAVDPAQIDEVILGCVAQPPEAPNLARVAALRSGIPKHVPAITVQRNCASGVEAITQAWLRIRAGEGELYLVGGVESMSGIPMLYSSSAARKFASLATGKGLLAKVRAATAFRPRDFVPIPGLKLGLSDPVSGLNMGETAEILAREFEISRAEQDTFALRSHLRAAQAETKLAQEIVPAYDTSRGIAVVRDNGVRAQQTLEALAKLRPVFEKQTGTVTAGNSSQITDGAVALLIGTESSVQKLNLEPLGAIRGFAYAGCAPERMGLGPVYAIERLLERLQLTLEDADLVEINEAFAAQVLAVLRKLKTAGIGEISDERLNVNGGAIALGHPVGASGARLVLTALKELHRREAQQALVSLCVGGGQGAALWLERL